MTQIKASELQGVGVWVLLLVVFGLNLLSTGVSMATNNSSSDIEIKIDSDKDSVHLLTMSNGCTNSTDFGFSFSDDGEITATRIKRDRCRRKPFAVIFAYSLSRICQTIEQVDNQADEGAPAIVEGMRIKP